MGNCGSEPKVQPLSTHGGTGRQPARAQQESSFRIGNQDVAASQLSRPRRPFPEVTCVSGSTRPRPAGLFRALQKSLLQELQPSETVNPMGSVLVVDDKGIGLLEAVVKVVDLTRAGLPLVEKLENIRQPLPQMPAVYLVAPTIASADLIARDWDSNPNMYQECHVYALGELAPSCAFLAALKDSHGVCNAIKSVKQLQYPFVCQSEHGYTLTVEEELNVSWLERFFSRNVSSMEVARNARLVAEGIVSSLGCLGDRPTIRYQANSHVSSLVAGDVLRTMNRVLGKGEGNAQSGVLLIVDRTYDVITPLLHQFLYEPMLRDLYPQHEGISISEKYQGILSVLQSDNRVTVLDANNEPWHEYRHQHIDTLRKTVTTDLRETLNKSKATKIHPELRQAEGGDLAFSDFSAGLRELPAFQRKVKALNLHMEMLLALRHEMEQQLLVEFALTEQNLVTQETESSKGGMKKLDRKTAWKQLLDLLKLNPSSRATYINKVRAVLLYTVTQNGLSKSEKATINEVLQSFHPSDPTIDQWLSGLSRLHIATEKEETRWWNRNKTAKANLSVDDGDDGVFLLSRAVPRLKDLLQSILSNTLDLEGFPVMDGGGAPSLYHEPQQGKSNRRRSPSWISAASAQGLLDNLGGPRIHVFVVGGVSPAEISAAAAVQKNANREILIGGTDILSPNDFARRIPFLETLKTASP